jgi:(R,R)-butanediol dehydrogenase / meso-butanediol dehydrogenase / diacetyl reductase
MDADPPTEGRLMHAAVYTGAGSVILQDRPEIPPGPHEVRIDVSYTGICGTDLHIFHGDMDARVRPPSVLGHEMSGRIRQAGTGVEGWRAGDAVTVMPLIWCGLCPACRSGHQHLCHRLTFIGIDSAGAMQGSWTVPASILIRLPEGLPLSHGALVEPVAVAVHDVRRADLHPGEKAVVVGGGPVGLLIATVARQAGAEVIVVEPDAYRRSVAEQAGLLSVDPSAVDVAALVGEWTSGAGADVSFEVSGAGAGVASAVDVLRVRGRLVLVAIHPTPRPVDLHRFFWRELSLIGARLYRRSDFDEAVTLVSQGLVPTAALISQILPISAVAEAFDSLQSGSTVMKVLIDCQAPTDPGAGA